MSKVFVAMSGGVDSTVCALLLRQQGFEVEGITMITDDGATAVQMAAAVCAEMGIPHHVADLRDDFRKQVIDGFCGGYFDGVTPNPCVLCNRQIKFGALMDMAFDLGADRFATGHFVRVERENGGFLLKKAIDPKKDQSYVLYSLSQQQLGKVLFPLGAMSKTQVREIAREHGLSAAQSAESQDICFIPDGDYAEYIESHTGRRCPPGKFIGEDGAPIGPNRGIIHYTVGQRKGLGVAWSHPLYVLGKDAGTNTVTLGPADRLLRSSISVGEVNWISEAPAGRLRAAVRTRYHQAEAPATVLSLEGGGAEVCFDTPVRAPAPGQAAVFYDGDTVLGGGVIL